MLLLAAAAVPQVVIKGNIRVQGNVAVHISPVAPFTYSARTDNCVTGSESGCVGGRTTGQAGSTMSFLYRSTDAVPFPAQNCTTGTQSACANNAATDPDFGAYMVMVTDPLTNSSTSSFNMGSNGEWDAFNLDSSLFLVSQNGGAAFLYSVDPNAIHAKTCTPSTPCVVESQIRTGSADSTHLAAGGDWSFSRIAGENNVLYEESPTGTTISKLTINTGGSPSAWTLTRTTYVDWTSDTPVACSALPSDYVVGWSGVFATANDGSITKAYGGGSPWHSGTVYTTDSFIYPQNNNSGHRGFQITTPGTSGGTEPTWSASCNAVGQTCTDSNGVVYTNVGNLSAQGNGFDLVNYRPGVGCSHLNTRLGRVYRGIGVSDPAGLITSQDDIVCARAGTAAPCSMSDRWTIHDAGTPFNSSYSSVSPTGAGSSCTSDSFAAGNCSCADATGNYLGAWNSATAYAIKDQVFFGHKWYKALLANTNSEPDLNPTNWVPSDQYCYTYVWQVASTVINPCMEMGSPLGAGGCSGHSEKGYAIFYKGTKLQSHYFSLPSINGQANPGVNMLPTDIPGDRHGSGRNENATDTLPFLFANTEVPTSQTDYVGAGYAEDIAIKPDGSETMWRFMHNFNTGSSAEFSIQNAIGVISQDGKFAAIGTDMMGTRGSRTTGGAACNNLRGDYGPTKNRSVLLGDKVYPVTNNANASIFQAQGNGTEGSTLPNWNTCSNVNDLCVDGTVTWKNVGINDCRGDIVIIDLLSAHPLP